MGNPSTITHRISNTLAAGIDNMLGRGQYMAPRAPRFGAKDGGQTLISELRASHNDGDISKVISILDDIKASRPDELKALLGKGFGEPDKAAIKLFRDIIKDSKKPEARNLALEVLFDYLKSDQASTVFTNAGAIPRSEVVEVLDQVHEYLRDLSEPNARLEHASKLASTLGYHQVSRDQKVRIDTTHTNAGVISLEPDTEAGEHSLSAARAKFNLLNTLRNGGTAGATVYALLYNNGSDSVFLQDNRHLIESFVAGNKDTSFSKVAACQNAYEQIKTEMPSVSMKGTNLNLVDPITKEIKQEYSLDTFLKEFCSHESSGQERAIHNLIGAYFSLEAQKQDIQTPRFEATEFDRSCLVRDITSRQINMLKTIFGPEGIVTEGKFGKLIHDRAVELVNSKESVNMAICTAVDALSESNVDAQVRKFTAYFQKSFGMPLTYNDTSEGALVEKPVANMGDLIQARGDLQTSFNDQLHNLMTGIFAGTGVTQTTQPDGFYKLVNDLNTAADKATETEKANHAAGNADDSDISDLRRQCTEADSNRLVDTDTVSITLNKNQADYLNALIGETTSSAWDTYRTLTSVTPEFAGTNITAGTSQFTKTQALKIIELMKGDGQGKPEDTMIARKDTDRRQSVLRSYGTEVQTLLLTFQGVNPALDNFNVDPSDANFVKNFTEELSVSHAQRRLRDEYVKHISAIGSQPEVYLKKGDHIRFLDSLGSKRDITNPEAGPLSKAETRILDILRDDDRAFQIANPAYVEADQSVDMRSNEANSIYESADFTTVTKFQPARQAVQQDGLLTQFLKAKDITGVFHDPEKARFAALEMLKRIGPGDDPVAIEARTLVYTKILGLDASLLTTDGHLIVQGAGDKEFSNRLTTTLGPTKFSLDRNGNIRNGGEFARISTVHHRLAEIDVNIPTMNTVADTQFFIDMSRFGMFAWNGSKIDKAGVLSGLKEIQTNLQTLRTTEDPARRTELITRNLELSGFAKIGMGGDHHDSLESLLSRSHVIDMNRNSDVWTRIMQYINYLLDSLAKQQAAPNN